MQKLARKSFKIYFFILLLILFNKVNAQSFFLEWENDISLTVENIEIPNAWAGGLNAPQFSTIHLNNDEILDLIVFDRTTNKLHTFIAEKQSYKYAPEYETLFPEMRAWVLSVDYDKDGRKDLFTHTNFGMKVYRNTTLQGENLSFELIADPLRTKGFTSQINLQVPITDIPALVDIDEDGDLDIITFDFVGSLLEYHKNFSIERYGNPNQLELERISNCWGDFQEGATCGDFSFNLNCEGNTRRVIGGGGNPDKIQHVGSTILILDLNGDNKKDVLIGDVSCNELYTMFNENSNEIAIFKSFFTNFPASRPINFPIFPAVFFEDVNFDGKKDLLASPNVFVNEGNLLDFQNSVWFYENQGSIEKPDFQFNTTNFLQNTILDLGEETTPAFLDFDADGDLDMIIGMEGLKQDNSEFYASLYLFENIGTQENPSFVLKEKDFLGISSLKATALVVQFQDINQDDKKDFLLTFTKDNQRKIQIAYAQNNAGETVQFSVLEDYPLSLQRNDFPLLVDANRDGVLDALVAHFAGNLSYLQNTGTNENPTFQEITDTLGGITSSPLRTNLRITTADLNQDGRLDLISTDNSGKLKIYSDFRTLLSDTFAIENEVILDTLQSKYASFPLGSNNTPTVVDWDNDNLPDLVIGTGGGGIRFLKNTNRGQVFVNDNSGEILRIYPNPTNALLYVNAKQNFEGIIFDSKGNLIQEKIQILENQEITINLQGIPIGVYFLQYKNNTGKVFTKRFVIVR